MANRLEGKSVMTVKVHSYVVLRTLVLSSPNLKLVI
jgi:hypothetical protein